MERKGGCCLAPRYGAAAAAQQQAGATWQMGRIMLKFRPIAPKPAAMAPKPAAQTPVTGPAVGAGRGKRKAVCGGGGGRKKGRKPKKVAVMAAVVTAAPAAEPTAVPPDAGGCRKYCEKKKSTSSSPSSSSSSSGMTSVDSSPPPPGPQQLLQPATLPLMPVTPVEDKAAAGSAAEDPAPVPVPFQVAALTAGAVARPFAPRAMRPGPAAAASLVTVEEVTTTWRDGEAAPCSAACVVGTGAADEAPAFVSDRWGRVTWRNAAFVRAVSADDDGDVALGGAHPAWGTCAGFTCRVRVRHSSPCRRVGSCSSVVAPCDVWRLDAGGSYLWRLDLHAALTLGPPVKSQP